MLIFLYGQDTYRMREKLREIIEEYKKTHKSGLNLRYFDGQKLDFDDFQDETQQISMFQEKKLMVINNVFSNSVFKEKFLENSKRFLSSKDIIIFLEESTPRSDKFFKFLTEKTKSQEFKPLTGENLRNWVKKKVVSQGASISSEACQLLIDSIGQDIWQMANEIDKLASFKRGQKIEKEDINLLVKPTIENDIFKTIDAIAQKNRKQAISLMEKHLKSGDNPLYLLSMINFQFRNLLIVKDLIEKNKPYYSISKISGLHPFVVKKSYLSAQKFAFCELKKIYQNIFQVDLDIKTGKISPEVGLDLFLTSF